MPDLNHGQCVIDYVGCSECMAPEGIPCKGNWNSRIKNYDTRYESHTIRGRTAIRKREITRQESALS